MHKTNTMEVFLPINSTIGH